MKRGSRLQGRGQANKLVEEAQTGPTIAQDKLFSSPRHCHPFIALRSFFSYPEPPPPFCTLDWFLTYTEAFFLSSVPMPPPATSSSSGPVPLDAFELPPPPPPPPSETARSFDYLEPEPTPGPLSWCLEPLHNVKSPNELSHCVGKRRANDLSPSIAAPFEAGIGAFPLVAVGVGGSSPSSLRFPPDIQLSAI